MRNNLESVIVVVLKHVLSTDSRVRTWHMSGNPDQGDDANEHGAN